MKKFYLSFLAIFVAATMNAQEISWMYTQWISKTTIGLNETIEAGGLVFISGITEEASTPADQRGDGVFMELGFSSTSSNPSSQDWIWKSISFNQQWGNNWYYQGKSAEVTEAGKYYYSFRAKIGESGEWKYAGNNGLWNGSSSVCPTFEVNVVQEYDITWMNTQWVASTEIDFGGTIEGGSCIFIDGITNATEAGTGDGVTAQIGFSTSANPTEGDWYWNDIAFSADWGDDWYFQGKTSAINTGGTIYYTFRAKYLQGNWKYAGTNGLWDGSSNVCGTVNVAAPSTYKINMAKLTWVAKKDLSTKELLEAGAVVYSEGITNNAEWKDMQSIEAQIGYSAEANPTNENWIWQEASFNKVQDTCWYFQGKAQAFEQAGDYYFTYRFRIRGAEEWVYAGMNGTWDALESPCDTVHVTEFVPEISWMHIQWIAKDVIEIDETINAGGLVFIEGITEESSTPEQDRGKGVYMEIGFSKTSSDPTTDDWTWNSENLWFNQQWGNNWYYQGFSAMVEEAGDYYYSFRAKIGEDGEWKYAGTDGLWDGITHLCKTFTVNGATDLNRVKNKSDKAAIKVMRNGRIFIYVGNTCFDILGNFVK